MTDTPNLRGNPLVTAFAIIMPLVTLVGLVGSLFWQASKYPDRAEFASATNDLASVKLNLAVLSAQYAGKARQDDEYQRRIEATLKELASRKK